MLTISMPRLSRLIASAALLAAGLESSLQATINTKFVSTGNLNTARAYHTATLLGSGKILITGGQDTNLVPVATSELFIRNSGSFVNSGAMITPRYRHTATRLFNGKVVVIGGLDSNNNPVGAIELYNPTTGAFTNSQSTLLNPRYNHTAVLLPDGSGKVLIIMGIGNSGALSSVEIYDSTTDTISPASSLNTGRYFGIATPVTSHGALKVLVAGGFDANGNVLNSSELYDPTAGAWTYTGNLHAARYEADDALLPLGKILVCGGNDPSGTPLASAEIFNPATGQFTITDSLDTARASHTATTLLTGKVLVAGGVGVSTPTYPRQAEIFKSTGFRRFFAPGDFDTTGKMITGRFAHTATLMANGQVLYVGGIGDAGVLGSAEIFRSWAGENGDDDDDCND
jgi:hypothetical protein